LEDLPRPIIDYNGVYEVESESNNLETVYEMRAIFPDSSLYHEDTGGCESRRGFKDMTLQRMITQSDNREATIISRPTVNVLRDYQGNNLMGAFPLQFPYGIGSKTACGKNRNGVGYDRHLTLLSEKKIHTGMFVFVIHNMLERQRMVANSS
jgi:hypothetical protein